MQRAPPATELIARPTGAGHGAVVADHPGAGAVFQEPAGFGTRFGAMSDPALGFDHESAFNIAHKANGFIESVSVSPLRAG